MVHRKVPLGKLNADTVVSRCTMVEDLHFVGWNVPSKKITATPENFGFSLGEKLICTKDGRSSYKNILGHHALGTLYNYDNLQGTD